MKDTTITINDVTWDEVEPRKEKPSESCGLPTRGRIEKTAYCMPCGLAKAFEPIRSAVKIIRKEM